MADIDRGGSAVWTGSLFEGKGRTSVDSGLFRDAPVSFASRFEQGPGTNPEELVAAAHASCFSMALSGELAKAGSTPAEIRTHAAVTLRAGADGAKVVAVHLDVVAKVPGMQEADFRRAADAAKTGCPISKLLAPGLESLTMEASLAD